MKTFTQTEDIDLDASEKALLETFRRNEGSSLKTLIGIYKGHYLKLFFSILFFAIKHSPVWVLPIVTSNIINVATERPDHAGTVILINALIMSFLLYRIFLRITSIPGCMRKPFEMWKEAFEALW